MKEGWKKVKFGMIANFSNGINFNKTNFGEGIKVLGVSNFKNYISIPYNDLDEINPDGIVKENNLLKENDIVFVRSNGNKNLIGRSLLVQNLKEPITHSAFTIRSRITSRDFNEKYISLFLQSEKIRTQLSLFGV